MNTLYLVIPCYNEESVLPETARQLYAKMTTLIQGGQISPLSRVVFVDDGSKDETWALISRFHREAPLFSGISLSRNRGQQNALLAGLLTVKDAADMTISMGADLQDDLDVIDQMVEKCRAGKDIVYGVVTAQGGVDTGTKRFAADLYPNLARRLGGEVVQNHSDFRLLSRRALDALSQYQESALFLRGIVPMLGFSSDFVYYKRAPRQKGESKHPPRKIIAQAIDGITSLSLRPLRLITALGLLLLLIAFITGIVYLIQSFLDLPFWTFWGHRSLTLIILIVGGLQLVGLGIVGEYAGKTYIESKRRPRFFIDKILHTPLNTKEPSPPIAQPPHHT